MKAQDIVDKLSAVIPLYTSGFSTSLSITSIIPTGVTALATTSAAHGLIEGQNVAVTGAEAPVEIDTASFLRTGSTATFETDQDHDLTLSERDKAAGDKTVILSGATESEFNDTFLLLSVVNRRKLIIAVDDSGPTTVSGSPIVENANGGIFNGLFPAVNITSTTFEYTLPVTYALPAAGTPIVQKSISILSVLDIDIYLNDIYTKQAVGNDHLVVVLGDVTQSQNRNEQTDASDSTTGEYSYTPVLVQTFGIYVIQNVTDMLGASEARDKIEVEYLPAIFKSILRAKFDTGFTYNQYRSTFTGHGVFAFADASGKNKAIYVHEVTFQQLAVLDKLADTVAPDDNVAMRDIDYTLTTDLGTGELTASIDLDEEPIP